MRELRRQSGAHSFAGIHERVDEHGFLQDRESFQSAPWIVSATKKNHWGNYHAEHQPDMLLIDAAPECQSPACGERRYQYNDHSECQCSVNTDFNSEWKQGPLELDHDQPGDQIPQHSGDILLDR